MTDDANDRDADRPTTEPFSGGDGLCVKKPPLGVMPTAIWREKRMADLARAIHERIDFGLYDQTAAIWCDELSAMIGGKA